MDDLSPADDAVPRPRAGGDPDARLFERFMAGDDAALMDLFDRHHHRIVLYCVKIVGSREQAEDLAQELWERLIRLRKESPRPVTAPIAFMLTIARNLCLNVLRASRRFESLDNLPETMMPTVATRELTQMEELVALSLPKLPLPQREVLVLHAYCGYRFEDIAEMLKEPVGTIRMRASRARAHLGRIISTMIGLDEDWEKNRGSDQRTADTE